MTTSPPAKGTGYIGLDPSADIPISLRVELRSDVCACCGARLLVHAACYQAAQQVHRLAGKEIFLLCPRCGDAATEMLGATEVPALRPRDWRKHFTDHKAN